MKINYTESTVEFNRWTSCEDVLTEEKIGHTIRQQILNVMCSEKQQICGQKKEQITQKNNILNLLINIKPVFLNKWIDTHFTVASKRVFTVVLIRYPNCLFALCCDSSSTKDCESIATNSWRTKKLYSTDLNEQAKDFLKWPNGNPVCCRGSRLRD